MNNGTRWPKPWIAAASLTLVVAGVVQAQGTPPGTAPAGVPAAMMAPATKDPAAAPEGTYRIDLEHSSVDARVSHRGMSYNVVRFGVREGTMHWNPADPAAIALDVTVDAKPYYAPIVYKIPPESAQSLNVAKFPEARFVSTAVHVKDGGRATIDGQLTLMGVTKPVAIEAELVGIGRSMEGAPTAGFTGTMAINWGDFTAQPMARMIGKVTVVLDAEFIRN